MTTETLFDNTEAPKNYLQDLVGDDKKFKTTEDLARGKYESDNMIKILERKHDELREDFLKLKNEADSKANLEALLDRLEARQTQHSSNAQPPVNDVRQPSMNLDQVKAAAREEVMQIAETTKQTENLNLVKAKLKERYGDNSPNILREQIESLGMTAQQAETLARTAPNAFIKTLGLDVPAKQQQSFQTPPRSDARSDQFAPRGAEKRTWAWYQNLKKSDPKKYLDPKTNVQMHNDALALGAEFEDGDFNA